MYTTHIIALLSLSISLLLFLRRKKKGKQRLSYRSIEAVHGKLLCDGDCCSLNDVCSVAERLFCQEVLKKALPNVKVSAQHIVSLPSGTRKIDFAFVTSDNKKIAIELDGYEFHVTKLSQKQFDLQLKRQNELILDGWTVLRFSYNQATKGAPYCIKSILQLLGTKELSQARPFRAVFKDIFYPYEEKKTAINLLRNSGAQYSSVRERWYFPFECSPRVPLPEYWTFTTWTACLYCGERALAKVGPYGPYWRCGSCSKTFNSN